MDIHYGFEPGGILQHFTAKYFFKTVFCHESKNKAISIGKFASAGG
jgi:hypothetical protein